MITQTSPARRRRGSALVGAIIFSAVAILLAGSIINWSLTERRLNIRNAQLIESRNAAEALAEYGFSQIRRKFETRSTFNLKPGGPDALQLPPSAFWSGGNVSIATGDIELIGGTITPVSSGTTGSYYFVDPANANNANDPLRGRWVWRRDVQVIAKATVRPPQDGPITSYASQSLSVRGAPLFAHAIFYNMDLEIAPGPEMHIYGPVHANGSVYLSSQGSNSLNFHGQVTAAGDLYRAWKFGVGGTHGTESLGNGQIKFVNRAGELVSMKVTADGKTFWADSTMGGSDVSTDFRTFASQRWNGNLLTASHGITNYSPVAVGEYREADPNNPSVSLKDPALAPSNSGRLIIEPPDIPSDPTASNYASRLEIERQKYSNAAGVYIQVTPPTTDGGSPTITVSSRSKDDLTKNKSLTLPSSSNVVAFKPYQDTEVTTKVTKSNPVYKNGKWEQTVTTTVITTKSTALGSTATETSSSQVVKTNNKPSTKGSTNTAPAVVESGLYDQRRQKGVNLIELDMDALRLAVAQMAGTSAKLSNGNTQTPAATDGFGGLTESDWTGIVYVEVVGGPSTDHTTGETHYNGTSLATAADRTAVLITNGKGKVPSHGTANEGLTIATNAPVYIKGDFNADGTFSTGTSNNSAHVPESGELPAAIAGDAITLLSAGFDMATSRSKNKPGTSDGVEISAALLTGISPTNPTLGTKGESSGGAHNFPRFLENWGHPTYIRGSLVSLFESRIASEPWSTDYYSPPARNWGFNDLFAEGRYPPGTPRVMSYRRVDFTNLNDASYQTVKSSFSW